MELEIRVSFQLKMFLDNVRDLVLMPVSPVAALIDLIMRANGKARGFIRYYTGVPTAKT